MKLFSIRRGYYWGWYFLGKPITLKLSLFRITCREVKDVFQSEDEINVVPIDRKIAQKCAKTPYRVKKLFDSTKDSFCGVAAIGDDNRILGYVCGKKIAMREAKRGEGDYFDGQDYFYMKYVYVDPECRGKKLSARMIKKLANDVNLPFMANCRTNNYGALKVYKAIGFKCISLYEMVYWPIIHKGIKYRDEVIDENQTMENLIG